VEVAQIPRPDFDPGQFGFVGLQRGFEGVKLFLALSDAGGQFGGGAIRIGIDRVFGAGVILLLGDTAKLDLFEAAPGRRLRGGGCGVALPGQHHSGRFTRNAARFLRPARHCQE
jgi:hypothetical protein